MQYKVKTKNNIMCMKKSVKQEKVTFYDYYTSLSDVKYRVSIRRVVLEQCGMSYPAFYAKIRRRNFGFLEKKEIEKILAMEFEW